MERLTKRWCGNVELASNVNEDCATICHNNLCEKCAIQKAFNKLAEYEDLEEQGLLLKLPCKVGDIVWTLKFPEVTREDGSVWTVCDRKKQTVVPVKFTLFMLNDIGVYYFLTKEEAERRLERIKNNE